MMNVNCEDFNYNISDVMMFPSGSNQNPLSSSSNDIANEHQLDGSSVAGINPNEESYNANPDDLLRHIDRLEKYSLSDIIFHRQVAARSILETLHEIGTNDSDLQRVLDIIQRFTNDSESSIRTELTEQIPHVISYFLNQNNRHRNIVPDYILPILVRFLTDTSNQVRKISQSSVIVLFEQNLLSVDFIEKEIFPILIKLADVSNLDDYRIEATSALCKVVRFLGKELTEKLFIQHFIALCSDVSFHIRRVCSSSFGDICTVVGQSLTETLLLPQFKILSEDGIWGVRKSCADVFIQVSCICSNEARRNILAPLFVTLLCDQSRWVKTAAYQALGPFISTFADPSKTGLYYGDSGVIIVDDFKDGESNDSGCCPDCSENVSDTTEADPEAYGLQNDLKKIYLSDNRISSVQTSSANDDIESEFNSFQFWKPPIPDLLELELDATSESIKVHCVCANLSIEINTKEIDCESGKTSRFIEDTSNEMKSKIVFSNANVVSANCFNGTSEGLLRNDYGYSGSNNFQPTKVPLRQDIVPNELLEHYLSMTNPINYQTVDPELNQHCAYSLPAVALTLGRKNWHFLKETYEVLASDMQWKVRWTLASSLNQMAVILGSDYTSRDLLPIFLNFMKDLDEVRFGILQNLAAILKLLRPSEQQGILPKISDFLKMDNNRNWRFRYTLAEQLIELCSLYTPLQIKEYLIPLGLSLLRDKVAEVRLISIRVLSTFLRLVFKSNDVDYPTSNTVGQDVINQLNENLSNSKKWKMRQSYVLICEKLVEEKCIPYETFINAMLGKMVNMCYDPVPNVRLALSRSITRTLWYNDKLRNNSDVIDTLQRLCIDKDVDVRRFAQIINLDSCNINTISIGEAIES